MSASNISRSLAQLSGRLVNLTRRNRSIRLLRKTKRHPMSFGPQSMGC